MTGDRLKKVSSVMNFMNLIEELVNKQVKKFGRLEKKRIFVA